MHVHDLPSGAPIFQRICGETGEHICIDIEGLASACRSIRLEISMLAVLQSKAMDIVYGGRIDMRKLRRIPIEALKKPCILIEVLNGPDIADGNHRYVLAAAAKIPFISAYLVPERMWREYLVEGMPSITAEELKKAPHQVIVQRRR